MPSAKVLDMTGKAVGDRELPAELFEASINVPLMHQVVVAGLAAARAGTHSTKTRAEVSGGGRKPWRQKGTGRARHGSNRSPIWVGGGVAHGPQPRDHAMRVNKKMKRGALRSALTDTLQSGKLAVIDELAFEEPRTKEAVGVLESLELWGRVLVVLPSPDVAVELSFRNLPQVKLTYARNLSVYDLLFADRVLFTRAALDALEGGPAGAEQAGRAEAEAGEAGSSEPQAEEAGG
jgi:large subunit ribosomal protein L4